MAYKVGSYYRDAAGYLFEVLEILHEGTPWERVKLRNVARKDGFTFSYMTANMFESWLDTDIEFYKQLEKL